MRSPQRGFTLIEVMVTCALVGVLAVVVVPMFWGEARKGRAKAEVSAMFAELAMREDQYKLDQSAYLVAAACPSAPAAAGQDATGCVASGQPWNTLRVILPQSKLACSYAITVGTSAMTPAPPAPFVMTKPPGGWYYIIATCDMDGSSSVLSKYFTASNDTSLQVSNEGK
jgi:prepilin-type N-terminal cleavage/methylation domain-containing protein